MVLLTFRRNRLLAALTVFVLFSLFVATRDVCLSAWLLHGVKVRSCPDGQMHQTAYVQVYGLRRGSSGTVRVGAFAHYTTGPADSASRAAVRRFDVDVALRSADGKSGNVRLEPRGGWDEGGDFAKARQYALPAIADGDYVLTATVRSSLGTSSVDLDVGLYAPARIHVITDRPLFQPGDTVQFRAVVFRAKDLAPLDARPGKWIVVSPSGQPLLEERAATEAFGVVAGSFPLDDGAPVGQWTVRYASGNDEGHTSITVEPFTLPRFAIEAQPSKPFFTPGEQPVLRGSVTYSSGAPVSGAAIDLDWSFGDWAPTEWREGALPVRATADDAGRFTLELPPIPGDIHGQVRLGAAIGATDPAGDRVTGAASLLFSRDRIRVSAVTELGGRLVEGFNNRVYLRAETPSGRVLPGVELDVRRAWDPSDDGVRAETDADGVAALQLDPGPPVNVVLPSPPVRAPPREPPVVRTRAHDAITAGAPALADQVAMDRWNSKLEDCARFADDATELAVSLRVDRSGRVRATAGMDEPLAGCIRVRLAGLRLPSGKERLYTVGFQLTDEHLPRVTADVWGHPAVLDELRRILDRSAKDARRCLREDAPGGRLPRMITWRTTKGRAEVAVSWIPDPRLTGRTVPAPAARCIEARFARLRLGDSVEGGALGTARLRVVPSRRREVSRPPQRTMLGYELAVTARSKDEALGSTRIRLSPGVVPELRMRATPVLPAPGGKVQIRLIRGPGFSSRLPDKLHLSHVDRSLEAPVDPKTKTATFEIPDDLYGWFEARWSNARALVFVRSKRDLEVEVSSDRPHYSPGDRVQLSLQTRVAGQGVESAVGLIGVDETLGQLVPLPGPDAMGGLMPRVETAQPAFGALDGQALASGRISGANAAAATVLQVTGLPSAEQIDVSAHGQASAAFEPLEALTDHFYTVLSELHVHARRWEAEAAKGDVMTPPKMARLWSAALAACRARGDGVEDAFGRPLRLSRLPQDLLALTAPRAVVVEGTRLPEDVEDWPRWVRKEQP